MPPQLSHKELAESYGFAYSFLRSDKSLWALFDQAVKGTWSAEKFAAQLKNTSWYRKNSESVRQYKFQWATDPATVKARHAQVSAQISDLAHQMGARVSAVGLNRLTQSALMYQWNDNQLRDQLSRYVKVYKGVFAGQAGDDAEKLRNTAYRNGINVSSASIQKWVMDISAGRNNVNNIEEWMRQQAARMSPTHAKELAAGMDLYDIAQPYMQSAAKILEINPADVDLFSPEIRSALNGKGADGKPASKSLWQFEQDLKKDPRWLKTKNAQDNLMQTTRGILKDFGFTI